MYAAAVIYSPFFLLGYNPRVTFAAPMFWAGGAVVYPSGGIFPLPGKLTYGKVIGYINCCSFSSVCKLLPLLQDQAILSDRCQTSFGQLYVF